MAFVPPPPPGLAVGARPSVAAHSGPSAAAAAGAAAAALLQRQLFADAPGDSAEKGLPDGGWTEHQTGDGRKFYHHEATATSVWEKPDALKTDIERRNDTDWAEYKIWDGRAFYHHRETKVSCWIVPPDVRKIRSEPSGVDERPLPSTSAEQRRMFMDLLKEKGVNESWTWKAVDEATCDEPAADGLSEQLRKQCYTELLSLSIQQRQIEAREKQRNAASALERLIEERFSRPEDLMTSYEDAKRLLENEEAWDLMRSDMRRDEVFQTVMERLEEKHRKTCADLRAERVVRLQRLFASDPELRRPRLRWKDAAAILARRDELQEEDPPLEAMRVWSSLRELRSASEYEADIKARERPDPAAYRDERKRRDAFATILKELIVRGVFKAETSWVELEPQLENDARFLALREGPGATAMELFDDVQEDFQKNGYDAVVGSMENITSFGSHQGGPPAKRQRHGFDPPMPMPYLAAKKETEDDDDKAGSTQDISALDEMISSAARGAAAPVGVTKDEPEE